jgi:hypothetical protein
VSPSDEVERRLDALAASVRSYDAVVVIGAGLSAFGYPMTADLPALLWQAINDVDGAQSELAVQAGRPVTARDLDEDRALVGLGWDLVRANGAVRQAFQTAFASLDAARAPSLGHRALAELIHDGRVHQVISYNWDTCLERAYTELYGTSLPRNILFKPHGDVGQVDQPWTLPDEDGLVPENVLTRLRELDDRPRTLISLGYSGSDPAVVEHLLAPLQNKWPVFLISPSARGAGAVPVVANRAMAHLVERVVDQSASGWRVVTFQRRRDLLSALRGERLRPVDALGCPELPYVPALADRLRTTRFASLSGDSGTGKSITGFHAALRLHAEGWEVVELLQPGVAGREEVQQLARMPGPVVAVVDDAQALDPSVVAALRDCVDDRHAVLLISTERLETHNDEVVSARRAKDTIYRYLVDNLDTVGPLLAQLDDRVGTSMGKERPEHRLEAANVSAHDPWALMFVASGGDRRVHGTLERLLDHGTAAAVLGVVAVNQMTSQDAGVDLGTVARDLAACAPALFGVVDGEVDTVTLHEAMTVAQQEMMVREHNGVLRTAHIRVADRVTAELAKSTDPVVGPMMLELVRTHLRDTSRPLRGKYWLVSALERHDRLRYGLVDRWLDHDTTDVLVAQALEAAPGSDRLVALNLLWRLGFVDVLDRPQWEQIASRATDWLPDMDDLEVFGFRWFLGGVRSRHDDLHQQIRDSIPASVLATMLSTRGTRVSASAWATVLRDLGPAHDAPQVDEWRAQFLTGLDIHALAGWVGAIGPDSHNDDMYDLVDRLAEVCPQAAAAVLRTSADQMRASFETDLLDASQGIAGWAFGHMLFLAMLAGSPHPVRYSDLDDDPDDPDDDLEDAGARRSEDGVGMSGAADGPADDVFVPSEGQIELAGVVRELVTSVDWSAAGRSLSGRAADDVQSLELLLFWVGKLSVDCLDQLSVAIPHAWLDEVATQSAQRVSEGGAGRATEVLAPVTNVDRVGALLRSMSAGIRARAHARSYLESHMETLQALPFHLIEPFPDLAATLATAGRVVMLQDPRARGWVDNSRALRAVGRVDRTAATTVLRISVDQLASALEAPQANDLKGLTRFIRRADDLDPSVLDRVLVKADPATCERVWGLRLPDQPEETRSLLSRAASVDGVVGEVARGLLRE